MQTLEQVCATVGYPKSIRVDQGSEFVSRDLNLWAYAKSVTLDFSRPGKPTDTDVVEEPFPFIRWVFPQLFASSGVFGTQR